MIKVYYTIEKKLYSASSGYEEATGMKEVTVYTIEQNVPTPFFDLDLVNTDNTEEEIQVWLNDNGYEEKEIKLIQL